MEISSYTQVVGANPKKNSDEKYLISNKKPWIICFKKHCHLPFQYLTGGELGN